MYMLFFNHVYRRFRFVRGNVRRFKGATTAVAMRNELNRLVSTIVDPESKKVRIHWRYRKSS